MTEEEFKERMELLAEDDPPDITIRDIEDYRRAHTPWEGNRIAFHLHARNDRPRHFLRWSTIQMTMFVGNAPYIKGEWKDLMGMMSTVTPRRWERRLIDPWFGRPVRSNISDESNPRMTGNFINQAYTLNQYECASEVPTEHFNSIFEFGAGYGALCYIIHKLGFMGKYQMYDLPELELIQRYYLGNTVGGGIDTEWLNKDQIQNVTKIECDLFIANNSLSETSISFRDQLLDKVNADHYYITYLPTHNNVSNRDYFNRLQEKTADIIVWQSWTNKHKKNVTYLYGRRKV